MHGVSDAARRDGEEIQSVVRARDACAFTLRQTRPPPCDALALHHKMTTQFDRVYHGLSTEHGSALFAVLLYASFNLNISTRIPRSLQRHGLERRGCRRCHCHVVDRHQMGTMAPCGEGLSTSRGLEGPSPGGLRWFRT